MNREKGSFDPDLEFHTDPNNILHILPEEKEGRIHFVPKKVIPRVSRRTFLKAAVVVTVNSLVNRASLEKALADGGVDSAFNFKLGIMDLYEALGDKAPEIMGWPVENEHFDPVNGNALQKTTTGLAVWRKKDNWTAFTNGSRTWVNGPEGVQERGNEERLPWENDRPAVAGIQATPTTLQPTPEPTRLPTLKEPEIIGTPEQIKAVRDAIELLRVRDPEHYTWVVNPDYVKTIKLVDVERSYVQSITKTISLHRKVFEEGLPRAASVIVHEASESKRVADWWKAHPDAISIPNDILNNELMYGVNAEIASITEEILTLKRCGGDPKMIAALESLINGLKNGTIAVQPGLGK